MALIEVNDKMQQGYVYETVHEHGHKFSPLFQPQLTPAEMLELGVFEGKYLNDCIEEYPKYWFQHARLSKTGKANPELNYFGVKSRLSLTEWQKRGWIVAPDPRGWFQWYCRYYQGRRIPAVDEWQIKRWRAFKRHEAQVKKNCFQRDINCRPKQRQALLQWAYDPFV